MSADQIFASELTGMAHATGSIVRDIESLFEGGSVAGLTDRQLLERFTASRDAAGDAAFAALVRRYGPMVLHVCQQLLGDRHDAEDAFQAVTLAQKVVRAMTIHKLTTAIMMLVFLAALVTGGGYLAPPLAMGDEPRKAPEAAPALTGTGPTADAQKPAPGRMFVVGSVLDPQGRPVPNATVAISLRRKLLFSGIGSEGGFPAPAGHGASDTSGRFRFDAARASSAHHAWFSATALAPGYGVGWTDLDPDEDRPSAEIRLMPEQVIEGRLFDVQGQPVPGAAVSVSAIWRTLPPTMPALYEGLVGNNSEGPYRWWCRVYDEPGWPKPATTDADGRFTLHGIGRGLHARLSVLDPRFAPQTIEVATDSPAGTKTLKAALLPARTLTGRVIYADTGRPAAHAEVHVVTSVGPGGVQHGGLRSVQTETDAEGRFRVSVMPGETLNVWAAAPDGQPYFRAGENLAWAKGATEQAVDLTLARGELIHGKVTEEGTGQPVADALVYFVPSTPRATRTGTSGPALTKPDGTFAFAVGPHPGNLSVQAPGEDYQLQVMSGALFYGGNRGTGRRLYAHAFLRYDPTPGAQAPEIRVALRRGTTAQFRLIGPNGQPARNVRVYSRAVLGPSPYSAAREWPLTWIEVARHGHFAVHGLGPETEVPVYFLQPERKLGATVRVSGKMATQGPLSVRLEPCGLAIARLVGPDGKPVTGEPRGVSVTMVVTPGPPDRSAPVRAGALAADEDLLGRVDPVNHGNGWFADAQGRITWPALIPGATYRIVDRTAAAGGNGPQVRREFVVGPGQALELGDVLIQKPPG